MIRRMLRITLNESRKLNLFSHNFTSHRAEIILFYKFIRSAKVRFHTPNFEGCRSLFISLGLENQSRKSNTIRKHEKSNSAHPEL